MYTVPFKSFVIVRLHNKYADIKKGTVDVKGSGSSVNLRPFLSKRATVQLKAEKIESFHHASAVASGSTVSTPCSEG